MIVVMAAPCLAVATMAPENIGFFRHEKTFIQANTIENLWYNNGRVIYSTINSLKLCIVFEEQKEVLKGGYNVRS